MNNHTGLGKMVPDRFALYLKNSLRKHICNLLLLVLAISTLSLIICPANLRANIDDGLVQAAYVGKLKKVRSLITKGVDINQTD
ncbi:MAG: hypothetical protein HKN90_10165, partial [Flavobacteriaceae bacterium]|nr:hypothetical protein [Flavobacteriaceae bacterium]